VKSPRMLTYSGFALALAAAASAGLLYGRSTAPEAPRRRSPPLTTNGVRPR